MRLITQRLQVLQRLQDAGRNGCPLLCPNAETPDEMEGVMLGAQAYAGAAGLPVVVVGLGVTASYPDHPQLLGLGLSVVGDSRALEDSAQTWLGWLSGYANRHGIFDEVEVIPFLDHGWMPHAADVALMRQAWFQEAMGIIMFDASARDFDENAAATAEFVREAGGRVVVEACPDKVYSHAEISVRKLSGADLLSQPDAVEEFVRRTRVDLLVPNLGTEHRTSSTEPLQYRHDLAQEIARRVGPIQALHGSSSLGGKLGAVGRDGICKINYYTAMARYASQEVRTAWAATPEKQSLPIGVACGSFLHRTRRAAIAQNVHSMLATIATESAAV